jgi:hypothetical protein
MRGRMRPSPHFYFLLLACDFFLYRVGKSFQVAGALLNVVIEQVAVECAGIMYQRITQVCEDLQAI